MGHWDSTEMIRQIATAAAADARANGVECELAEAYVRIALRQPEAAS
jgi:hypothetical protein